MYYYILLVTVIFSSISFIHLLVKKENYLLAIWILYLFFEILLGLISREIISKEIKWQIGFNEDFLLIYVLSLFTMYYSYALKNKITKAYFDKQSYVSTIKINKTILILSIPFLIISFKIYSLGVNSDAIDSRSVIGIGLTGVDFLVFKLGFIILALNALKKKNNFLTYIILIFVLICFSLYGGRFLIFSGILIFLLIFLHDRLDYSKLFKLKYLIPVLISYVILSTFIANTRYYMNAGYSFESTLTKERILSTAYMQLGGNWLDFSRVSNSNGNIQLHDHFWPTLLEGFLPSGLREYFFGDFFNNKIAYGKYFAETISESDNALRMNFTNEIFFSFGYIGVFFYSLTLGFLFAYFEKLLKTSYFSISLFFLIQLLSLHILGINTFSNAFILMLMYVVITKKYISKNIQ